MMRHEGFQVEKLLEKTHRLIQRRLNTEGARPLYFYYNIMYL